MFISIDFFRPADNPILPLPFAVPENYIPSARSTMKNLEDSVLQAVDKFPELAGEVVVLLGKISQLLEDLTAQHIADKASATLAHVDDVLVDVQRTIKRANIAKLSTDAQATLNQLAGTATRVNTLLERLQGEKGLIDNVARASSAIGEAAHSTTGLGESLEETLRNVQDAAGAIQRLGEALDRDSDMLLKGRTRAMR
jgi:paraquat-inducible protein B